MNNQQTQVICDILGTPDSADARDAVIAQLVHSGTLQLCDDTGAVVQLNLSFNNIQSLPDSVACWTSLEKLDLNHNALTSLPDGVAGWARVKDVDLSYNKLDRLPDCVGCWQELEHLDVCFNSLVTLPTAVGQWLCIRELDLSNNILTVLPDSVGEWTTLKSIELKNNPSLIVPAFNPMCGNVKVKVGSNAIRVPIRLTSIDTVRDVIYIYCNVLAGYADLVTDLLAISVFYNERRYQMMGLIIAFDVLHVVVYLFYSKTAWDVFLTIFQLKPLYEGYLSIKNLETTPVYASIKKVDAISRSMPAAAVQLFTIFSFFRGFSPSNLATLVGSVAVSIIGCAVTLATSDQGSGASFFSRKTLVRIPFYLSDIGGRVATVALMFTCIQEAAFIVIGLDFLVRLGSAFFVEECLDGTEVHWRKGWFSFLRVRGPPCRSYGEGSEEDSIIAWRDDWFKVLLCFLLSPNWAVWESPNAILQALVWMGTDTAPASSRVAVWGYALSALETFLFLIILNAGKDSLPGPSAMKQAGLSEPVTILLCIAWVVKCILGWAILPCVDRVSGKRYNIVSVDLTVGGGSSNELASGGVLGTLDWLCCGCPLSTTGAPGPGPSLVEQSAQQLENAMPQQENQNDDHDDPNRAISLHDTTIEIAPHGFSSI